MIDELIPVIQPEDWQGVAHTACRPFFQSEDSPLYVAYAVVTPESNMNLTEDILEGSGKTLVEVEEESIARWVGRHGNLNWEELEISGHEQMAMAVTGESDVISSMLLSHGHLKGIQQHFGGEIVQVIIPNRFTLLAHPCPLSVPSLALSLYQEAQVVGTELSPYTFQLMGGEIVGYAQLQSEGRMEAPVSVDGDPVSLAMTVLIGAFLMVAAAGGDIDKKEVQSFAGQLTAFAGADSSFTHQACARIVQLNFEPVTETIEAGFNSISLLADLLRAKETFESLAGSEETVHLRLVTRQIARKVAEASGGGIMGLRSKVSKEEKAVLEMLEGFLG